MQNNLFRFFLLPILMYSLVISGKEADSASQVDTVSRGDIKEMVFRAMAYDRVKADSSFLSVTSRKELEQYEKSVWKIVTEKGTEVPKKSIWPRWTTGEVQRYTIAHEHSKRSAIITEGIRRGVRLGVEK